MMSASSLPTAQAAMPAGFATFLANIGQVSEGNAEGGFDQLVAAAPTKAAAAPVFKAVVAQIQTPPAKAAIAIEIPAAEVESLDVDAAAQVANLLSALNGTGPATTMPKSDKPAAAESEIDATPDMTETPAGTATNWAAIVAATAPATTKVAKPVDTPAAPADSAPATPLAARPRDAAPPLPLSVAIELPVAKTAEAAPSMTILFAQPAAQGAATLSEMTAPAQIAERVLDMDSDGAWIDQLARDIAATKSDSGDISFRLMPRHLGRLDVAMQMGDDGVALKMDTHHEATATIVTAAQGRLVDELRQQGVRVTGAEVTCTPGETGRQSANQGQSQGHGTAQHTTHLIETATERAEPRDEDRAAERRGRFA